MQGLDTSSLPINGNTAVSLENATVGYRDGKREIAVVTDINAALYKGEVVALIGANGAGKSTLLRTLSAFQHPLSGKVVYATGNSVEPSAQELARYVSIVLTENNLLSLSVAELVALGRSPYTNFLGYLTAADKAVVAAAMERMGVRHLATRPVATLSDGERQKCMIAKAIAQGTPLMLLDEPTAFLDFRSKVQLFRTLRDLAREAGKAVLVSTHDIEMALRFAHRLWLIDGTTLYDGSVAELAEKGLLQRFIDGDGIAYDNKNGRIEITFTQDEI